MRVRWWRGWVSAGATLGLAIPLAADFFAGRPPTRAESQVPAQDSSITIHERWMDCICIIALQPDGWIRAIGWAVQSLLYSVDWIHLYTRTRCGRCSSRLRIRLLLFFCFLFNFEGERGETNQLLGSLAFHGGILRSPAAWSDADSS